MNKETLHNERRVFKILWSLIHYCYFFGFLFAGIAAFFDNWENMVWVFPTAICLAMAIIKVCGIIERRKNDKYDM